MKPDWYRLLDKSTRRAFWAIFAGFSLDAMDVQVYAFVLPALAAQWGLGLAQAGLLASVTLAASAIGGAIGGILADRFGRARMLRLTVLLFASATCCCGLVRDFDQLLVARAMQGLGFGSEWAVGAVFIAEMAPASARGRMVGLAQSAWVVGWGLAAALSTIALVLLPEGLGWRGAFLLGVIPAGGVFLLRRRITEPSIYLAIRHQPSATWRKIFGPTLLPGTLKGSLLAAGVHGGYWAIATWWPLLLAGRGHALSTGGGFLAALLAGALGGYVTGSWLSDRFGRRATLAGFAFAGIALALSSRGFSGGDAVMLFSSVPLGFVALGMYSALGPLLAEIFPTELRGAGLGTCYNCGRGIAGATPLLVGGAAAQLGLGGAMAAMMVGSYGLVVFAVLLLPETRGRELGQANAARL